MKFMNTKPNNPDELIIIDRQFSLRTAWRTCRWLFLAVIISIVCDMIYLKEIKQWPMGWRIAIVLVKFSILLLWVLDVRKWIRGMDELQRRITLSAFQFGVSATLFFMLLWRSFERIGFFDANWGPPPNGTWGIYGIPYAYLLLSTFYGFSYLFFKRRYK